MSSGIDLQGAQPRYASGSEPEAGSYHDRPKFNPQTGERIIYEDEQEQVRESISEMFQSAPTTESVEPVNPANPYAPTGWKRKQRVEFDVKLPSGQLCRLMRLEREDLFRMNLLQYLDTFTPLLMDQDASSEAERDRMVKEAVKQNPDALANLFMAIDEVVMAATVKPRVTQDEDLVDYGQPKDWNNPRFVPTAFIKDIDMEDRMVIFASAFGKSMDDLKSLWREAPSVGSVADESSVPQAAE